MKHKYLVVITNGTTMAVRLAEAKSPNAVTEYFHELLWNIVLLQALPESATIIDKVIQVP